MKDCSFDLKNNVWHKWIELQKQIKEEITLNEIGKNDYNGS